MKSTALFEIGILIVATISFSYFIGQTDQLQAQTYEESSVVRVARTILLNLIGSNLVSAEEGIWTCAEDKQGSVCQEYPAATCAGNCNTTCFPGRRTDFSECSLGTCIDKIEGTCAPETPKKLCQAQGSIWKDAAASELVECRRGCCLMGDQAQFLTEQTCSTMQNRLGLPGEFRPVANELECIALAGQQAEGACVFGTAESGDVSCKFVKKGICLEQGGAFYEGQLCSNTELKTDCQKQARIGCFPGKDEVYWFDSCGNRENIYDANKAKSWNNGVVLAKNQSCDLTVGSNPLARQASCGNCNYLEGSVCGTPLAQDAKPSDGNAVCRNLNCIDDGVVRKHGESWCAFESQIGVQGTGNAQRSVDLPGSTHYRKTCFEGQVTIEPCQGFRNEICVESHNDAADFSQASCRINQWQLCIDANTDKDKLAKCEQTTDCVIKTVNLGGGFTFDRCVPRDPPGFDLQADYGGEVGESLCSLGSQTCTVIYQKNFAGKWKCKQNCQCLKAAFTETMNNLCTSLGDCGADVNILGEYTDAGYTVKKAPKLNQNYISTLTALATPKDDQKVAPLTERELASLFNLDPTKTSAQQKDTVADMLGYVGLGALGTAAAVGFAGGASGISTALITGFSQLGPFANFAGGAAVGAAMGYFLGKVFGLKGEGLLMATVIGAAAGVALGGLVFFNVISLTFAQFLPLAGLIVLAAVLIIKLLGIGSTKKVKVQFQCKPWQPPKGGARCEECGKDGLPCTKYQCQSLGQACEFVNEGTGEDACINSASDDVLAPVIQPYQGALLQGFSYSPSANGYTLRGSAADGCLPAYTPIQFGISLNERATCKIDSVRTANYGAMQFDFGDSNLYKTNHTQRFFIPTLDALAQAQSDGVVQDDEEPAVAEPLVNIDPTKKTDLTLYARCQDVAGNTNVNEYAINFCISPAPDRTPPLITQFLPESPGFVKFGAITRNITFYTNEPAECRWNIKDMDYDSMSSQQASCGTSADDATLLGYPCSMMLPIGATDETTYYFRCKDQPWLTGNVTLDNGKTRNKNTQGIPYTIRKTVSPLTIVSVEPSNGTISSAGIPIVVDLKVKTSGGSGNDVFCEFMSGDRYIRFFESIGNEHSQPGLQFIEQRSYSIPIRCKDEAGNEATSSAKFTTYVDNKGPFITRVYQQNGLTVVTNEAARCAYSLTSCAFLFSNGTAMQGNGLLHSTSFNRTATHYVTCKDNFENPGVCIAVRAGSF